MTTASGRVSPSNRILLYLLRRNEAAIVSASIRIARDMGEFRCATGGSWKTLAERGGVR